MSTGLGLQDLIDLTSPLPKAPAPPQPRASDIDEATRAGEALGHYATGQFERSQMQLGTASRPMLGSAPDPLHFAELRPSPVVAPPFTTGNTPTDFRPLEQLPPSATQVEAPSVSNEPLSTVGSSTVDVPRALLGGVGAIPAAESAVEQPLGTAGRFLGRHVYTNPIGAGMGGTSGGDAGVTTAEQRQQIGVAGKFAAESAPVLALYAAAPEAGIPTAALDAYFAVHGIVQAKPYLDAYQRGDIDAQTMLKGIALTAGPSLLPVVAHGLGAAAKIAGSPETRAAVERMGGLGGERGSLDVPGEVPAPKPEPAVPEGMKVSEFARDPKSDIFTSTDGLNQYFSADEAARIAKMPHGGYETADIPSPDRPGEVIPVSVGRNGDQFIIGPRYPTAGFSSTTPDAIAAFEARRPTEAPPAGTELPAAPAVEPAAGASPAAPAAGELPMGEAPTQPLIPAAQEGAVAGNAAEPATAAPGGVSALSETPSIDEALRNFREVAKTGDPDATAAALAQLDAAKAARANAPTISSIESQSKPLTPEERAAIPRDTEHAFFNPSTTEQVTASAVKSDMDVYQRIQNLIQKVPGLKSVGTYIESTGAARAQSEMGNPIPLAMVKRDITVGRQASEARAGLLGWAGGPDGQVLGIDPKGIATKVELKPGAQIPKGMAGRLDDIFEHPEDYSLTPEQQAALLPIRHTLDAVTQHAQAAGVDVHEVAGPYFPRTITKAPSSEGSSVGGGGIGSRLTSRAGFTKLRVFPDTRSAVAAGYQVATPIEALGDRLVSGVKATANKEAFQGILALGEKPSERLPAGTTQAMLDARQAYKTARASGDQRAIELAANELDAAKRDMRKAGLRAATPLSGEAQAYGRIFSKPVMDELAKYGDVSGPGVVQQFFDLQRADETTGDHSSLLVQGGNLLYRNPVAWMKSAAYSTAAFAREPWGWVGRNMDAIDAAVKDGAAQPPSEFLIGQGAKIPFTNVQIGKLPVIKQTQRMFEWMTFMGQVEWHKAAVRMGMSDAERQELGAVIRKGMGSSSMPGVTSRMRTFDKTLWYAGGFMRSTLGLMADASRGGVRGAEARKTLGMVIGGATAATIALQYKVDGTLPNLTDPNRTDKRWGYVEFPGGGVNLYGPLFPYIRLVAKAGQDLQQGDTGAAGGEGASLVSGKLGLPIRTAIDIERHKTFTGEPIAPGWKGALAYLAKQGEPLGIRQATEGALSGQLQQFPEQGLEVIGGRTTPNSDYQIAHRALIAAGVAGGLDSGDLAAIADARASNPDVAKALDAYKYTDYVIKQRANDAEKQAGLPDANQVFQLPVIQNTLTPIGLDPKGFASLDKYKVAFVAKYAPTIAKAEGVSLPEAETLAGKHFDAQQPVKDFKTGMSNAELYFWQQNPKLFDGLVRLGVITPTNAEQKILDEYRATRQPAGAP